MQYATGEYIGFVDADDWIEPNMYELLYEKMSTGQYDTVNCKYADFIEGEANFLPAGIRRDVEYHFTPCSGLYYGEVADGGDCGELGGLWSGLYRASMLREREISFPEHLAYEDGYFAGLLKLYVSSCYVVDVVLYHYCFHPNSTLWSANATHHLDRMAVAVMLVEEYKRRGALEVYHDEIEWHFLTMYFLNTWHLIFIRMNYIPDIMEDMKNTILRLFPNYRENPYVIQSEDEFFDMLEIDHMRLDELAEVKAAYVSLIQYRLQAIDHGEA